MRLTSLGPCLVAVVVWGALSFGAVYPWAYWPLVSGCAALGVWGLRTEVLGHGSRRWLALWLSAVALGAIIQLIPLPRGMLLVLGPSTDAFLAQVSLLYASEPSAGHALSIAPDRTLVGLGLFLGFGVFLLGTVGAIPHIRLEAFVRRMVVFGVLMAAFAMVQKGLFASGGERLVYGIWRPLAGNSANPYGPFINRNHFAGWMVMTLALACGYAGGVFERSRPLGDGWRRWMGWAASPEASECIAVLTAVAAMGASVVLSFSRSGVASFAVATIVVAALAPRARRAHRAPLVVVAAGLVLLVVAWAGFGATLQRFAIATDDLRGGRMTAWRDAGHIIRDFPIFGSGLNTFGTAMLVYQTASRSTWYREAHNDYLQLAAEGGLLLSVPAALAAMVLARTIRRRFAENRDPPMTRWIRVGAVGALAGIAAQSTMDFSLQMPGNTALFLVVLAIAAHRPIRSNSSPGRTARERPAEDTR